MSYTSTTSLLLSYFLSMGLLLVCFLTWPDLFFLLPLCLFLRWFLNPVRKAYQSVYKSLLGKISNGIAVFALLGFAAIIFLSKDKTPTEIINNNYYFYSFVSLCIPLLLMTFVEEIKAASEMDHLRDKLHERMAEAANNGVESADDDLEPPVPPL